MDTQRHNAKPTSGTFDPLRSTIRGDGRFPAGEEAWQSNGKWDEFPQPRGWALDWDGFALSALQETYNQCPPTQVADAPADGELPHG